MTQTKNSTVISPSGATSPSPNASVGLAELRPHHECMLQKCIQLCPTGRVLDFGCGKGAMVEEGRRRGLDIHGVEAFAAGSGTNIHEHLDQSGMLGATVREIVEGRIPHRDASFDLVVSNQVFEHIADLRPVLEEISRVLKPGGRLFASFPTLDTLREAHCRIAFAHWLPKSRARFLWLLCWRSLGFGRLYRRPSRLQWARFFDDWLEDAVHYRSTGAIKRDLKEQFESIRHVEEDYVATRLCREQSRLRRWLMLFPMNKLVAWTYRRWCGLVLVAEKKRG